MTALRCAAVALSVAAVAGLSPGPAAAQSAEVIEPYFYVIVDTSGSMSQGNVGNSCGQAGWPLNAAKCVLQDLINGYGGDALFGLAQFRMNCFNTPQYGTLYATDCYASDIYQDPVEGESASRAETLVPIARDNQAALLSYVDFLPYYGDDNVQSCPDTSAPEILTNATGKGTTPLAGSLRAARRYYEGGDPDYPGSPAVADTYFGCRPYYVILLTDGEETCANGIGGNKLAEVELAANQLHSTVIPGAGGIDIPTYVIGFGISAGDAAIESIAIAGGTDAPGAYNAFYATDEAGLALAFSQIIQDSVLVEICDNADNDCDGQVDEGFTKYCDLPNGVTELTECVDPGDPCDGVDDNCFAGITDEVVNACGTCGDVPLEICDTIDNDCDGFIDEGDVCDGCFPEPEICDGKDNDCDGLFDEGVTRPCGSNVGVCTPGEQICEPQLAENPAGGTWGPCDGTTGSGETCNGLDDNCDGIVDGFAEECYEFPTGCVLGVGCEGICQTGSKICTAGAFGTCDGDIGPAVEICNGIDDDCDGDIDEGNPGGGIACGSSCGVGETQCIGGQIVCVGGTTTEEEVCNGIDDDCDGAIDEDLPPMGPCMEDELCMPGELQCVAGSWQCVGGVPPEPEACDCEDNDCDDEIDEDPDMCPPGASCLAGPYCQCARRCAEGEFPCPLGYQCVIADEMIPSDRFCVPDPCFNVMCEQGQICEDGDCVPICDTVECSAPLVCRPDTGSCVQDNCYGFPERCTDTQLCVAGECVDDPCSDVECTVQGQYCLDGECVGSCADITCPEGQMCSGGVCSDDPCYLAECSSIEVCDPATGECVLNQCSGVTCPENTVCDPVTGDCIEDPCLGVTCPGSEVCENGSCVDPPVPPGPPDAGPPDFTYVAPGGGGGCGCRTASGGAGGLSWLLGLMVVAVLWPRRRRS